jgi:hypothetical protein
VQWSLGVGSTFTTATPSWQNGNFGSPTGCTNLIATSGATLYLTGVQLEVGSSATGFEYRQYQQELALCQRYFISYGGQAVYEPFALGVGLSSTTISCQIQFPVTQRAALTGMTTLNAASFATNIGAPTSITFDTASDKVVMFTVNVASGAAANLAARLYANGSTTPRLQFSSEL